MNKSRVFVYLVMAVAMLAIIGAAMVFLPGLLEYLHGG